MKLQFYFQSEYDGQEGREDGMSRSNSRPGYHEYYDDDEDNRSMVSLPAELPPPPDGGWGWVIVFMSFLCNMIVDGIAYSFSPFLDVFVTSFDSTRGTVSWISSLLAGVYLSAGQ